MPKWNLLFSVLLIRTSLCPCWREVVCLFPDLLLTVLLGLHSKRSLAPQSSPSPYLLFLPLQCVILGFSYFRVCGSPGDLLKCRFWFSRSQLVLICVISNNLPGGVSDAMHHSISNRVDPGQRNLKLCKNSLCVKSTKSQGLLLLLQPQPHQFREREGVLTVEAPVQN